MNFVLPKLDHTMEEGTIAQWFFTEGETVEKGAVVVSVETNKSVLDVESPVTGKIQEIIAHEGDIVPVFGVLAVIE